jgi:hypothetical protein
MCTGCFRTWLVWGKSEVRTGVTTKKTMNSQNAF